MAKHREEEGTVLLLGAFRSAFHRIWEPVNHTAIDDSHRDQLQTVITDAVGTPRAPQTSGPKRMVSKTQESSRSTRRASAKAGCPACGDEGHELAVCSKNYGQLRRTLNSLGSSERQ